MLLQQLILDNIEEIAQADRLGLDAPKSKLITRKMVVNVADIKLAYVNKENNIEILIEGFFYEVKYTELIWSAIGEAINNRKYEQR